MNKLIIFLAMTVILFSCKEQPIKEDNNDNDIVIEVCDETSPVWLINEINSIVNNTPYYQPVEVYSTVLDNVTYVLVVYSPSHLIYTMHFFLCSGEAISADSNEYNTLQKMFIDDRENFILLWSNPIIIEVCNEVSPAWLIDKINSIVPPMPYNHRPVSVYSTKINDVTYVMLYDMLSSGINWYIFLCSGASIPFDSEQYNILLQKYTENRNELILLWSNINIQ